MRTTNIIALFVIAAFIFACSSTKSGQDNKNGKAMPRNIALEAMSMEQLRELNRELTKRVRSDYHSWSSNEPERWGELSQAFADQVISANRVIEDKRDKIAEMFVNNIKLRSEIKNSNPDNKRDLMIEANNDLIFNLQFLIGIEQYNNWQKANDESLVGYNNAKDSLNAIIAVQKTKRIQQQKHE